MVIVPDHRGEVWYDTTNHPVVIDSVGQLDANLIPVQKAASFAEVKQLKIANLELARNLSIDEPIISAVLGDVYTYAAKPVNRQFLNDLVTLNNGGKFTCIDANGIKSEGAAYGYSIKAGRRRFSDGNRC